MKISLRHRLRTLSASLMLIGLLMPAIASACNVPYITISKSGPTTIVAGQVILYIIQVTNHAPDSYPRFVKITDPIPSGLTFIPGQSSPICIQSSNDIVCNIPTNGSPGEDWWAILPGQTLTYSIVFLVPADAACGTVYQNQAFLGQQPWYPQSNANPNPVSQVVSTTVVCQSSSSSSSIPSSSSSSNSSSVPSSSSSSSTPLSSSSSSIPTSSSSSSATPIVVIPGNSFSNSTAIATNLSNNQNTQNVSIFNGGANINVGAPNINVNTGGANVAVSATASPATSVVNNTQGALQYQPQYPPYLPPVYQPQPSPPPAINEKPVIIHPPVIVQPLPKTGIGNFTGSVENTRRFLSPATGGSDGGLIATAFLSLALLFGATGIAGMFTKRNDL